MGDLTGKIEPRKELSRADRSPVCSIVDQTVEDLKEILDNGLPVDTVVSTSVNLWHNSDKQ